MDKKNVIIISTDELRFNCLGYVGHPFLKTPAIDSIASEGSIMERAYCTTPLCVPSRTTLFNGQYARRHEQTVGTGFLNKIGLGSHHSSLPSILRDQGYELALFGKNHAFTDEFLATWDQCEMYDINGKENKPFCSPPSESDRRVTRWRIPRYPDKTGDSAVWEPQIGSAEDDPMASQTRYALEYLEQRDKSKPFFMYYSFEAPHGPWVTPEPYFSMYESYQDRFEPLPTVEQAYRNKPLRALLHWYQMNRIINDVYLRVHTTYLGQISLLDHQIGKVLKKLKETGQYDNSILVFFSDHGSFQGRRGILGKGNFVYEDLIHVPLILRVPGVKSGRNNALVELTDITPTLLDLLGIDIPESMQGQSFRGLLEGKTDRHRNRIVCESRLFPVPGLTRETYRYLIENSDRLKKELGIQEWLKQFARFISCWVRCLIREDGMKLILNENEIPELYGLQNDPGELENLADRSKHISLIKQMTLDLDRIDLS